MGNKQAVKGLLIHVSHYDPMWYVAKKKEKPFDAKVALDVVRAMSDVGMNMLIIDFADGVKYRSHPELKRHYSVPMDDVKKVADAAHKLGIDVVPKLNFAKSGRNLHDDWMRPYSDALRWTSTLEEYYKVAADCIAEVIDACRPKQFFHIGMDEDHHRSHAQYVDAIKDLRKIVKEHKLRTVIWNDSCHWQKDALAQVHADKCRYAEDHLPKDIVQVLWDYGRAQPGIGQRVAPKRFDVWVSPGHNAGRVASWRRGKPDGFLLTHWIKCEKKNRTRLLKLVRTLGPQI